MESQLLKVPKNCFLLYFEVPEIHLPVAFAGYYNRAEKREKKLQNIIFEHVRNVSMNVSATCP